MLEKCIWPILNPVTSEDTDLDKIHHMAKIPTLFQCWINSDRFIHLFFKEFSNASNFVAQWIINAILNSQKIEATFKEKVLTLTCSLIIKLNEDEEHLKLAEKATKLYLDLDTNLQKWIQTKIRMDKDSVVKLKTLTIIGQVCH